MQDITRLPRGLVIAEIIGGLLVLLALVLVNSSLPIPGNDERHILAKISLAAGILLILPAVIMIVWRTIRAMFPGLSGKK